MKAVANTHVTFDLTLKGSGALVLREIAKYSKTIGQAVAAKEGLSGDAANVRASEIKRCLRRVRLALEAVGV